MIVSRSRTSRLFTVGSLAALLFLFTYRLRSGPDVVWKSIIQDWELHHTPDFTSTKGHRDRLPPWKHFTPSHKTEKINPSNPVACQSLLGGDDIVVILRTGASEISARVPIHLNTTFLCYPNTLIISDFAESFHGHDILNPLTSIPQSIISTHPDFTYYRHLQLHGRSGLSPSELSSSTISLDDGSGKDSNPGWRLDKWKFLPMINTTYHLHPHKKWYIFIEADTYIIWSNLLQYLYTLNPSTPSYHGSALVLGQDRFAHGGSAIILSQPALALVSATYASNPSKYHNLIQEENYWAGDWLLGRALHDSGVNITQTWPMLQGTSPALLDLDDDTQWCAPALSYHHLTPDEVSQLWRFEQDWIRLTHGVPPRGGDEFNLTDIMPIPSSARLTHKDVFHQLMHGRLQSMWDDWDNAAEMVLDDSMDFTMEECRELCVFNEGCRTYKLGPEGCAISFGMRLGKARKGYKSGWLVERSRQLDCRGWDGWTVL